MLHVTSSPEEKRRRFAEGLASGRLQRFVGAFSPLVAVLIEEVGFEGVYVSGAALSADLGLPDIGLTTLTEVSARGHQIARMTNLPAFIDADTGFGEPMNAARTVRVLEDLGLAGCHIEDQVNPKRCGHLDNKEIVSRGEMVRRITAAAKARRDQNFVICARTDARSVEGLEASIARAQAYVDAGATMIFPEALVDEWEFEAFRKAVDVPILANMTEFGKSKLLDAATLQSLGVNMVIYPVTTLRIAMGAVERGLRELLREGSQVGMPRVVSPESFAFARGHRFPVRAHAIARPDSGPSPAPTCPAACERLFLSRRPTPQHGAPNRATFLRPRAVAPKRQKHRRSGFSSSPMI